jgi:hypothetical protein
MFNVIEEKEVEQYENLCSQCKDIPDLYEYYNSVKNVLATLASNIRLEMKGIL